MSASAGGCENAERDGFGEDHHQQSAAPVRNLGGGLHVLDDAEKIWRLDDDGGRLIVNLAFQFFEIQDAGVRNVSELFDGHVLVARVGARALRGIRDERCAPPSTRLRPVTRAAIRAASGHGGRTVIHRRVGHFHSGQLANHGLKFKDRGQSTLRDFRLIRRVGSQKLAARNHGIDHHGAVMRIHARAQKRGVLAGILGGARLESSRQFRIRRYPAQAPAAASGARRPAGARTVLQRIRGRKQPASRGVRSQTSEDSATSFPLPRRLDSRRRKAGSSHSSGALSRILTSQAAPCGSWFSFSGACARGSRSPATISPETGE